MLFAGILIGALLLLGTYLFWGKIKELINKI